MSNTLLAEHSIVKMNDTWFMDLGNNQTIGTTKYFYDFLNYYNKAKMLQHRNETNRAIPSIEDAIMENVHIYDCVERRQAGFSNVLEDIHGKRSPSCRARLPVFTKTNNKKLTRFIHLFHRFTGSGASFESDHGYRNSHVDKLVALSENAKTDESAFLRMRTYITDCRKPMVTSKGNQPPSLKNKDPSKYRLAMQYYFDNFAEDFVDTYCCFLEDYKIASGRPLPIKTAVDFCLAWHKNHGFKQWKFVMTAFVMDDAEYYPEDVDADSEVYFGSNCYKAFELMFTKPEKRMKKQDWHDKCMDILVAATEGQPYSLEDVACDMIRYWTEYIPKNGYNDLTDEQKRNNSTLKVDGEYPLEVKSRLKKVIGYHRYGQD